MTNFFPSSGKAALGAAFAAAVLFAGCGGSDGVKEYEAGVAAFGVRDFAKAEKLFRKSSECAPGRTDAYVYLARIALELGNVDEASRQIATAAELRPEDSDVRLLSAQVAYHAKEYDRAAKLFEGIAGDTALESPLRAEGLVGLGIVEMSRNRRDLARVAFLRAIRTDRKNAAAWYHLGLVYRDSFGYNEAAIEQFEIYSRIQELADARVQKVKRSVIPALREAIQQVAAARPGASHRDSAAAASALAKAEESAKKGAWKAARQQYEAALRADPISYPAALGLANAWKRTDSTKDGQEKAYQNLKLACQLRPSAVKTLLQAGDAASRLGYVSQSAEIYSLALAANPNSIEAMDGLIRSLKRKGGNAGAVRAYEQYRSLFAKRK